MEGITEKLETKEGLKNQQCLEERVKADPVAVYEEIVVSLGERLLRIAFLIVKDQQLAEDVVQESLLILYRKLPDFRGESKLETWLIQILINQAKRTLKTGWLQRIFLPGHGIGEQADASPGPVQILEKQEEIEQIQTCIQRLPMKYQEVLYLYYYDEMKIKEIAEVLDLGESAVKSRLKRGREKIAVQLKREGMNK